MAVIEYSAPTRPNRSSDGTGGWSGRGRFDLLIFASQLLVLLRAGLGVVESLEALRSNSASAAERDVIGHVLDGVRRGAGLSASLEVHPSSFPPLFVAMLRSAEQSSGLTDALERYISFARDIDQLRAKVRAAAVYPAFLLGVGALVIGFLLVYVVPRFAGIYESMHGDLPWAATLMLRWGQWVTLYWPWLVSALLAAPFVLVWAYRSRSVRQGIAAASHRLPIWGIALHRTHLARLFRTLAMLLAGGYPLFQAIRTANDLLPIHLRGDLSEAGAQIARGVPASEAFQSVGLSTAVTHNLLVVGERSGELHRMFDESARFIELETSRMLEQTMRVMEPALMTVIGLVIGVIVVLMYLPIFELAGSLS